MLVKKRHSVIQVPLWQLDVNWIFSRSPCWILNVGHLSYSSEFVEKLYRLSCHIFHSAILKEVWDLQLAVCLHSDVFVGFGVYCVIETWVFLDSLYYSLAFFLTPFSWSPEMYLQHIISSEQNGFETKSSAIIKNRTKIFAYFFSLVTSFYATYWSLSTGTFFNTWRRHNSV